MIASHADEQIKQKLTEGKLNSANFWFKKIQHVNNPKIQTSISKYSTKWKKRVVGNHQITSLLKHTVVLNHPEGTSVNVNLFEKTGKLQWLSMRISTFNLKYRTNTNLKKYLIILRTAELQFGILSACMLKDGSDLYPQHF